MAWFIKMIIGGTIFWFLGWHQAWDILIKLGKILLVVGTILLVISLLINR